MTGYGGRVYGKSWKKWGMRLNNYLQHLHFLLWPELIILGGGISKKFEKYAKFLDVKAEIVPAQLLNEAGIIGAAVMAEPGLMTGPKLEPCISDS